LTNALSPFIKSGTGELSIRENSVSYFRNDLNALETMELDNPASTMRFYFPDKARMTDALIGYTKIFAYDRSGVYIANIPLVKE
jgi:hypothetical protein